MSVSDESLTVTCVGPSHTRQHLGRLLQRAGVASDGADVLAKQPNSDAVICEVKLTDAVKRYEREDLQALVEILSKRLRYIIDNKARNELFHVFMLSGSTGDKYVQFISALLTGDMSEKEWHDWHFARTPEDAVTQVLTIAHHGRRTSGAGSRLDGVPGIETVTDDLRKDGALSAEKVKSAFGLDTMAELARAAKVTRQALDANPSTPAVIPVLEQLERIARVRTLPQLKDPQAFKAWWRRKLPALKDRSPYELWKQGRTGDIIELVEGLITGDTSG